MHRHYQSWKPHRLPLRTVRIDCYHQHSCIQGCGITLDFHNINNLFGASSLSVNMQMTQTFLQSSLTLLWPVKNSISESLYFLACFTSRSHKQRKCLSIFTPQNPFFSLHNPYLGITLDNDLVYSQHNTNTCCHQKKKMHSHKSCCCNSPLSSQSCKEQVTKNLTHSHCKPHLPTICLKWLLLI